MKQFKIDSVQGGDSAKDNNQKPGGIMKRILIMATMVVTMLAFQNRLYANSAKNMIQVAILLDTSNSMDGLIDQAKTQLWKIVNELARSKKGGEPINLNVALYEYGKDSIPAEEGYLRMIVPLTTDLDKISDELFKLSTNGGSEYCGTVIESAVDGLKWSKSNDDLKIIVIAGNEPFTQGQVDYRKACADAIKRGIIVNTIFCGNFDEGLNSGWKDGADLADGKYMNIDQNQQIVQISAPQDKELAQLGMELNETYIAYGDAGEVGKKMQAMQDANSMGLNPAVMAERSVAKASGQYKNESWDLVDAEKEGKVDLTKLDEVKLPDEMKQMTMDERKDYVDKMAKKREEIQNKINQLDEARRKYIANKQLENQNDTFDAALINAVREQAEKKNFEFE